MGITVLGQGKLTEYNKNTCTLKYPFTTAAKLKHLKFSETCRKPLYNNLIEKQFDFHFFIMIDEGFPGISFTLITQGFFA